jgi:hypothetical protein
VPRRHGRQLLEAGQKAANAAIDDRHMLNEQQVAGEQG